MRAGTRQEVDCTSGRVSFLAPVGRSVCTCVGGLSSRSWKVRTRYFLFKTLAVAHLARRLTRHTPPAEAGWRSVFPAKQALAAFLDAVSPSVLFQSYSVRHQPRLGPSALSGVGHPPCLRSSEFSDFLRRRHMSRQQVEHARETCTRLIAALRRCHAVRACVSVHACLLRVSSEESCVVNEHDF